MWFDNPFAKALCWVVILTLVLPFEVSANTSVPQPSPVFKKEELTQLLAPVALYPDALLAQMLMASTYPLEVVQADRWVKANPGLKGEKLDEALRDMQWDMSVKSLCHFPQVLAMMSDKIDWTQKVGDAFLAQQKDVMDVIQELRFKAYNAGNLTTTNEQVVFVRDRRVIIEPASPGVLYVPVYDPLVVYGPWWYPYYPPYSFYWPYWYPGVVIGPGIVFATAFFVGAAVLSWCSFGWHNHYIMYPRTIVTLSTKGIIGTVTGMTERITGGTTPATEEMSLTVTITPRRNSGAHTLGLSNPEGTHGNPPTQYERCKTNSPRDAAARHARTHPGLCMARHNPHPARPTGARTGGRVLISLVIPAQANAMPRSRR